jgi:predicted phage terminase large subunit-like protein
VFGVDTWQRAKRTAWDCYEEGRRTGGGVRGVGKGGGVTGRAVDLGIVDDVIKDRQEADSPALRDHAWKWLESAVFPRARRLIKIATRWHHDDPIGRLEAKQRRGEVGEPWTFVNIPALALENDPLGRKPGEPLWPGNPLCHGDADWYRKKQLEVGPYVWSALYQGQPTPVEGAMFRRGWFRYYEHEADGRAKVPGHGERDVWAMRRFATVDLAASTRTTADYTVVAMWAYDHATRLLLLVDLVRDRVEGPDLVPLLERVRDQWRLPVVFVERMGFQLTVIQAARRAGVPVRELRPDADKVSRALPLTAALEAGRVFFRASAQWLPALESELLTFPAGEHDDQVDALAYGVKVADSFRVMPRTGRHVEDREGWRIGR